MNYSKLREEPLKNRIRDDFFGQYKYTQLGNIDFVIAKYDVDKGQTSLFDDDRALKSILWAEAKQGTSHDIYESFVQLILTIGKEKTFEKFLPPKYIGAFDAEKFAFIEYHSIQGVFYQNDFNWNVTPSNHDSKEFKQLYSLCENLLTENTILFKYATQGAEFKEFIRLNFKTDKDISEKISVTKNNFTFVFQRWSEVVKPTISVDWDKAMKVGIISADFFLADLLSGENESLKDSLYVVLKKTKYELAKQIDEMGFVSVSSVGFNDKQKAYKEFWAIYARPPKEEYWDYIIGRRDLLVPQDIRERKGSFFTPQIWVEKSQQYLADVFGETWQDEYYIWDCCAGTGNLLNGLTNYRNVWASTLDQQDVDVMKDRIRGGWNMFENHVFQFDFLNDDFSKCPEELQEILNDEEKRKKLVIYINPPYAEGDNRIGKGRSGIAVSKIQEEYSNLMGYAKRELFIQFITRIYAEIKECKFGLFSTLVHLQGSKFFAIRNNFKAKLEKIFLVPANTFDNVKGEFSIGFQVWDMEKQESFSNTLANLYDRNGKFIGNKTIIAYENVKYLNDWTLDFIEKDKEYERKNSIGNIIGVSNDFQNQSSVCIENPNKPWNHRYQWQITKNNLIQSCIYFSVRKCIEHNWINHYDQFLYPNNGWKSDIVFQTDCLTWTLFSPKIFIKSSTCINHWIPFTEQQVGCTKAFKSNLMSTFINDFLAGKIIVTNGRTEEGLFVDSEETRHGTSPQPMELSAEAKAVFDAGMELWKYYHSQPKANPDASFYDIRKFFQGETKGRMNATSNDENYMELIGDLREKQKILAKKIEAKVYEYGFLK